MNDGTKQKCRRLICCAALSAELLGYFQYDVSDQYGQVLLRVVDAGNGVSNTFIARPVGAPTPDTYRACRHGDTPCLAQRPRSPRRDARGCGSEPTSPDKYYPIKAKNPGRRIPGSSEVNFAERPMTSVVRSSTPVNSSALAARLSAEGRESGRG